MVFLTSTKYYFGPVSITSNNFKTLMDTRTDLDAIDFKIESLFGFISFIFYVKSYVSLNT